jgi:hypothetical protein
MANPESIMFIMTTIASFFLALYAFYYFQKGFEMVPYVSKVEDLAAQ